MYAQLIICQDAPANSDGPTNQSPQPNPLTPSTIYLNWQLISDRLTTGKLIDLMAYLDELGFAQLETD